jgi:hypothetical protein
LQFSPRYVKDYFWIWKLARDKKVEKERYCMKKMVWILFLSIITLTGVSLAERAATLPEIMHPFSICVDSDRLYISEGVTVFIYSLKDFRLVKKFGKEGEGPGEVLLNRRGANTDIALFLEKDLLIISTRGKVIYFSKDGDFVKEVKTEAAGRWLAPLGELFVGTKYIREKDGLYHSVIIYDSNLKKVKEIYKHIHGWQGTKREFNPLTVDQAAFDICDDKVFVIDGARTMIRIYDKKGKLLTSIIPEVELVPFTEENKKDMIEGYKRVEFWRILYESKKHLFKFPKYYPPIRWFFLDPVAKKVYLKTEKIENEKRTWLVYDFNGKLIKKISLPIGLLRFYNGTYYRLLENEEEEVWELYTAKVI